MEFTIAREALLKPLQRLAGVAEKQQMKPILANVLVEVKEAEKCLSLIATDLEMEMIVKLPLDLPAKGGEVTICAKKLMDICRALPENAKLAVTKVDQKITLRAGRSRYQLQGLPAADFPNVKEKGGEVEVTISQEILRKLLSLASFAMAQQDVRYYLNGLLLVLEKNALQVVATDGHRLAMFRQAFLAPNIDTPLSVIIPRKAVLEMQRLFEEGEEPVRLIFGKSHLVVVTAQMTFLSKLIEGKFPDYQRVIPQQGQSFLLAREPFRQALLRASALFSDKYRGVGLQFQSQALKILAVTSDKDEVEDEIEIPYQGPSVEIGVNASYLLEYLQIMKADEIRVRFSHPDEVLLFQANEEVTQSSHLYVVMPMRL
jgi:DNA polymerase III subunit beta